MTDTPIDDVSDTALWVAAFRAVESERKDALFKDPLAAKLVGDRGREIAKKMPYPQMLTWLMAVRTVAIDRLIQEALALGVDTVVNIGAGLDTRPYRMDGLKDIHWVEIDFPHMIEMKTKKLADVQPRCRLSRYGLDFSDRAAALKLYGEINAQTKKALVITEGVIPYLTVEEAGQLAADLRQQSNFRYWIQDYRKANRYMRQPKKLNSKMKNAPFRFQHEDPLGYFAGFGWKVRSNINAIEEGRRIHRPFPIPFPFKLMMFLIPKERKEAARNAMGYVLLEAN